MKKAFVVCIVLLLVVGLLWFVRGRLDTKQVKIKPIAIGIIVYPGSGLFYLAQDKGFFKQEGVDVQIVQIPDENQIVSALASNRIQMFYSTPDFSTIVADAGVKAPQVFISDMSFGADGLVVKNDIHTIAELKDKKVYLSLGTPSHFLFRYLAEKEGLQSEDVALVNTNADQVGASFVAGKIDYGMTWEPWLSKARDRKDGVVLATSKDAPGIVEDSIIVRQDSIAARREDVKRVMRAFFKAVTYWENHKSEANAIMAKHFDILPAEFSSQMETIRPFGYQDNMKRFDPSSDKNIYDVTRKAIQIYTQDGILKTKPEVKELIDPTLLQELYQ